LRLCAFAGNPKVFLGVESVWPEKNISRKDAKIAKKKTHGRAYEAAPKYYIGSVGEIPL
jgi:hypothetical protein